SEDVDDIIVEMQLSKEEVTLSQEAQEDFIAIKCNTEWTVSSSAEWCKLQTISGEAGTTKVYFDLSENITGADRECLLEFNVQDETGMVKLIQTFNRHEINVSANDTIFTFSPAEQGTYTISIDADWIEETANSTNSQFEFFVDNNISPDPRTGIISYHSGQSERMIEVIQEGFSESILADKSGMEKNAIQIASEMHLGWNLGNTLEATGGETAWGNPRATEELIVAVKEAGFNAVRIPCSWDQHIEDHSTHQIKASWLKRVQEVVGYCVENDIYAILNIHWDGGWLENNCTPEKQEENNIKQEAIWKQIALYFRDYDENLLFAGTNEPNVDNATQMSVLLSYEQTFIDAVRATGGRNAWRVLIFQGPSTDIDKTYTLMKTLPEDQVEGRLMAEVHYYTPWNFCGLTEDASWGKFYYFWGKDFHVQGAQGRYPDWNCEEDYVRSQFSKMKTQFVDNGIPVILGEYGAIRRSINDNAEWQQLHNESRAYFNKYITEQAKNYGLIPFYWDEGSLGNHGFGMFDRTNNNVGDQLLYEALTQGADAGKYPF
nr:cellulase family glycosylhydrolase [Prolixibacteraceae bacterium]